MVHAWIAPLRSQSRCYAALGRRAAYNLYDDAMEYRARLTIERPSGSDDADRVAEDVIVEVGAPEGRLRARNAVSEEVRYLAIDFDSKAVAPPIEDMESTGRWAIVPGEDPATGPASWTLRFDDLSDDDVERFLNELKVEGCPIDRRSSP